MKFKSIIGQVLISALTCAVILHFATPVYVRDTVNEMECEKEDRLIIQNFEPSAILPLSHDELHKKREEVLKEIETKQERERQGEILEEVLSKMPIMSEEEMAKEAERIRQQENK